MTSDALAMAHLALARRARQKNFARVTELDAIVAAWRDAGSLSEEHQRRGRDLAHGLRGSAGTFGHDAASSAAGELEHALAEGATPDRERVAALVGRIDRALAQDPALDP